MEAKTFGHIMIDIETFGGELDSAIVSIGAVEFNMETGETGGEFYTNIDLQSCLDAGLKVYADTIMWWMQQSEEARKKLIEGKKIHIGEALEDFFNFISECGGTNCIVWGNGAKFDLGILTYAYNKINLPLPWDFRNERCVRTLVSFQPEIKASAKFIGTIHDAKDDCHHQIKYCSETYRKLKNIV